MPEYFAGTFGFALLILGFIWAVLMFFAPFFWYGAWYQAKQNNEELALIRKLLVKTIKAYASEPIKPINQDPK